MLKNWSFGVEAYLRFLVDWVDFTWVNNVLGPEKHPCDHSVTMCRLHNTHLRAPVATNSLSLKLRMIHEIWIKIYEPNRPAVLSIAWVCVFWWQGYMMGNLGCAILIFGINNDETFCKHFIWTHFPILYPVLLIIMTHYEWLIMSDSLWVTHYLWLSTMTQSRVMLI